MRVRLSAKPRLPIDSVGWQASCREAAAALVGRRHANGYICNCNNTSQFVVHPCDSQNNTTTWIVASGSGKATNKLRATIGRAQRARTGATASGFAPVSPSICLLALVVAVTVVVNLSARDKLQ